LRKVAAAFGYLALATVAGQLIGFLALAIVARRVSAASIGAYNFDLALATYVAIAGNFGVAYLATRDVAQRPTERYRILFDTSLLVATVLLPLSALFLLGGHLWLPDAAERRLLGAVVVSVVITALTPDWYLLARQHARAVAVARLAGQVVYGLLVIALIGVGGSVLIRYAWFNVLGFVVTGVIVAVVVGSAWRRDGIEIGFTFAEALVNLLSRMRRSAPFGYSLVVIQVYSGVAIPLLGVTVGARAVGIYTIASRLPLALVSLATVWISVFFPHGSAAAKQDPTALRSDVGRVLSLTIVTAVAIGCAAPFAARELMPLMFGHAFAIAAAPFALLSVACALVLVQATTSNVLFAVGEERLYAKLLTMVALIMIAADIPLCLHFGATGAAIAAIGAEALIVVFTGAAARRALGGLDIDFAVVRWAIPLAAGILASGLALAGHRASIFDLFVPAAGGLVLVTLGLGGIRLSAYAARA
jgi:PST family polysaccharide transporter